MKMFLRNALIALTLTAAATAYAGPTPRATVQSFLIAARAGNVEGVKRCLHGGDRLGNGDETGIAAMRLLFQGARITGVEEAGYNHCIVYVKIINPLTGESENYPMSVKKINGDWKICDMK